MNIQQFWSDVLAQRADFGAREHDAAFIRAKDFVLVQGASVLGDELFLALGHATFPERTRYRNRGRE